MKKKLISILLLFFILFQGILFFPVMAGNHSEQPGTVLIEQILEADDILPNILKVTKRVAERIREYNLSIDLASVNSAKGNSSFYIHNQLIPRTIALQIINSTFFTLYFSTSV